MFHLLANSTIISTAFPGLTEAPKDPDPSVPSVELLRWQWRLCSFSPFCPRATRVNFTGF